MVDIKDRVCNIDINLFDKNIIFKAGCTFG